MTVSKEQKEQAVSNEVLREILKGRNAECLMPLIEAIGNLDGLVSNGYDKFLGAIPKDIEHHHKELSEIAHILEADYDSLPDKQLIYYSVRTGEIRRARRIRKTEGAFLTRDGVKTQIEGFFKLLSMARNAVTNAEGMKYLAVIQEAPEGSTRITNTFINTKRNIPLEEKLETSNSNTVPVEVKTTLKETVSGVNPISTLRRTYSKSDMLSDPKDSMIVKEDIALYNTSIIQRDVEFDITVLNSDWNAKFQAADPKIRGPILAEAYNDYYTTEGNSFQKAVADYAVWNYILPKMLIKSGTYVSK